MRVYAGIDLAAKGKHEVFVLGQDGEVLVPRYRFATQADEIDRLREKVRALRPGAEVWWISEPTGTQWVTVGQYLLGLGDRYFLVSNQKAHDLRRFWARHVKNDAVDAEALARIGFMAPQALQPVKLDARVHSLSRWVKRLYRTGRTMGELKRSFWALAESLLPGVQRVLPDPLSAVGRAFFRRYANPFAAVRIGPKRFTQALERSAGRYAKAETIAALYALCDRAVELHRNAGMRLDFADLQEEVEFSLEELEQAAERQERIRSRLEPLVEELDPNGLLQSIPGVGMVTAAACLAALESHEFKRSRAFRAYTGLVPRVAESGQSQSKGRSLTKAGPSWLRTALYMAAEVARRWDPQLAAIYRQAMVEKGQPHRKAICAVATHLADRIYAVHREQRPYVVRDLQGNPVTSEQARALIDADLTVPEEVRARLRKTRKEPRERKNGSMSAASKGRGSREDSPSSTMLPEFYDTRPKGRVQHLMRQGFRAI